MNVSFSAARSIPSCVADGCPRCKWCKRRPGLILRGVGISSGGAGGGVLAADPVRPRLRHLRGGRPATEDLPLAGGHGPHQGDLARSDDEKVLGSGPPRVEERRVWFRPSLRRTGGDRRRGPTGRQDRRRHLEVQSRHHQPKAPCRGLSRRLGRQQGNLRLLLNRISRGLRPQVADP